METGGSTRTKNSNQHSWLQGVPVQNSWILDHEQYNQTNKFNRLIKEWIDRAPRQLGSMREKESVTFSSLQILRGWLSYSILSSCPTTTITREALNTVHNTPGPWKTGVQYHRRHSRHTDSVNMSVHTIEGEKKTGSITSRLLRATHGSYDREGSEAVVEGVVTRSNVHKGTTGEASLQ